jgi:hypothetical protein
MLKLAETASPKRANAYSACMGDETGHPLRAASGPGFRRWTRPQDHRQAVVADEKALRLLLRCV